MQPKSASLIGFEGLLEMLPKTWPPADLELVQRAYELALTAHEGQNRVSGESYIHHPLSVATILAELRLDAATIAAALLHDVAEDTSYDIDYIRDHFGDEVARLVDGVTKLEQINELRKVNESMRDEKAESLRKMFLAMVDDVRVVLIKLADRLHNMRTLSAMPEHKRRRIARETLDIFAPLANRLGIWQIKWELEDHAFRYLEPATYKELARRIQERRQDREEYVARVTQILREELQKAGIEAEVSGRPKHIYSIYRKMKRKGVDFDQIYDTHGLRVIVDTVRDCYAALGIVHSLWRPLPGEFDDYIATPKDNMYRSLHTAVVGPNGRPMEVQIRTWEMHRTAEYGIAAHWRYKEPGAKRDVMFENKIAWLRQLMEWRQEVTDAREFVDSMKTDVFQDRVYVFTPKGDIIDLPAGSTPIDFAYHVHTEVGHRCRGARVNGRLVPLDYQLRNGEQVEIITAKRGGPSRDWLNPNLGFVKTQRGRAKIRQWFRRLDRDTNIVEGRAILDHELKRLSVEVSYEAIAKLFNLDSVDDLLAAIGYGDINPQQIAAKVLEAERKDQAVSETESGSERPAPALPMDGVNVQGMRGLYTHLARCCNPLPGDAIIGYVTRGRGVSVHKRDCPNILLTREPERLVEVGWGTQDEHSYPVSIIVRAFDRAGLLRDIAAVVADEKVNMRAAQAITGLKDNTAMITATLDVSGVVQLSRLLTKIEQLPNVLEARRRVG